MKEAAIQLLILLISACCVGIVMTGITINTKYWGMDWQIQRDIRIAKRWRIAYWSGVIGGLFSIFILHDVI